MKDADQLLAWRNEPAIRAQSEHEAPIAEAAHYQWLGEFLLHHQDREGLFVALHNGHGVGFGRIDRLPRQGWCRLSYAVTQKHWYQGLGTALVRALVAQAKAWGYESISCRIKRDNLSSVICAMHGGVNGVEFV